MIAEFVSFKDLAACSNKLPFDNIFEEKSQWLFYLSFYSTTGKIEDIFFFFYPFFTLLPVIDTLFFLALLFIFFEFSNGGVLLFSKELSFFPSLAPLSFDMKLFSVPVAKL